jgi:hypothetical protein
MIRNFLMAVASMVALFALGLSATANAAVGITKDDLVGNSSIEYKAGAYSALTDDMLIANKQVTAGVKPVTTVTAAGQIALTRVDDLLNSPIYGSPFSLAYHMGEIAYGATHHVSSFEEATYYNGCYGAAAMKAFAQITGLSIVESQMAKVHHFMRIEHGDEPAKLANRGLVDELNGGGIAACHFSVV